MTRLARPLLALLLIPVLFAGPCGRMVGFAITPAPSASPPDSLLRAASDFAIWFAKESDLEMWDGPLEGADNSWDVCAGGPHQPLTLCWRVSNGRMEFQTIEWSSGGRKGKAIRQALIDSLRTRYGETIVTPCEWRRRTNRDGSGRLRETTSCVP